MNKPTFYDLLNCTRHSTAAQIATEFRLLSLAHHPDRAMTAQASPSKDEEGYKRIVIAYTLLSDPAERAVYDKWLDSGISIPFEQWRSISTIVHWTRDDRNVRLVEDGPQEEEAHDGDEREATRQKFRQHRL